MNFTPYLYGVAEPIPVDHSRHRCPGFHCPLAITCQRTLKPGTGPSDTPWLMPEYDDLLHTCDHYLHGAPRPHVERYTRYALPVPKQLAMDYPGAWQAISNKHGILHYHRYIGLYHLSACGHSYQLERMTRGEWVVLKRVTNHNGHENNALRCWNSFLEEMQVNPAKA